MTSAAAYVSSPLRGKPEPVNKAAAKELCREQGLWVLGCGNGVIMNSKEWSPNLICGAKARYMAKTIFLLNPVIPFFHYSTIPFDFNFSQLVLEAIRDYF